MQDENENIQLIDDDLTTVDTSMPLLQPGLYDLKIVKAALGDTKDHTAKQLKLELATTQPAVSEKGEDLSPGVRVFHRIMTTPKGEITMEQIKRRLGALVQAAGMPRGTGYSNLDQWIKTLEGKLVACKVSINAGDEQYDPSNEIKSFIIR